MKKRFLYISWAVLYVLCAGLGHITNPTDLQSIALTLLSLVFFIPGAVLLADALRLKDTPELKRLICICCVSLGLTMALLIANVFSVFGSALLGDVLFEFLILFSVPMLCSQHWILSMFLWACLLFAALAGKKKAAR